MNIRIGVLSAVAALHLLGIWALASGTTVYRPVSEVRLLSTGLILTNNSVRASMEQPRLISDVVVLQDLADPVMSLPAIPVIRYAEPNAQAVSVAPQLLDASPPDVAPFVQRAGLLPGESAVVVLRIQVLQTGQVGQVWVDVSSGSIQVDEAAMAYARAWVWVPGRVHGIEESTWIRQGVRLGS